MSGANEITILEEEEEDAEELGGEPEAATLPRRRSEAGRGAETDEEPELAALNDLEPGLGGLDSSIRRPQSSASTWSSGKRRRAPQPPGHGSQSSLGVKAKRTLRDRLQDVWDDPRQRNQALLWLIFLLVLIFTVLGVVFVMARFSSGFKRAQLSEQSEGGGGRGGDGAREVAVAGVDAGLTSRSRYQGGEGRGAARDPSKESLLLLLGGNDEESFSSLDVISREGACRMPDGFPAPLPAGRVSLMATMAGPDRAFACGGRGRQGGAAATSRVCWSFSPESNKWTRVPGLRMGVSHGTMTSLGGKLYIVGGRDSKGEATNMVQIMDPSTYSWQQGPVFPYAVWGHCTVALPATGELLLLGGRADRTVRIRMRLAHRFKPGALEDDQVWKPMSFMMRQGRVTHGCTRTTYKRSQDAIVVAGGLDFGGQTTSSVEILTLSAVPYWEELAPLARPRAWYPAVAVLRNRLIVAAGKNINGEEEDSVEEYAKKLKKWIVSEHIFLSWRRESGANILVPAKWYPSCVK